MGQKHKIFNWLVTPAAGGQPAVRGTMLNSLFLLNAVFLTVLYALLYFDILGLPGSGEELNPVFTVALPVHVAVYFLSRMGYYRLATFGFSLVWTVGVIVGSLYQPEELATIPLMYAMVPITVAAFVLPPRFVIALFSVFAALSFWLIYPISPVLTIHSVICLGAVSVVLGTGARIRIRQERELQRERGKAIHASKLVQLGELAGGISHEINTPLTVILGHSERIEKENKAALEVNEKISIGTENIESNCHRIHRIVQALKRFSRDGSRDPIEVVDVNGLLDNVASLCQHRLNTAGVSLDFKITEPSLKVSCRAVEIEQVLVNLLGNAVDAVEGLKTRNIQVTVERRENQVRFTVSDSGPGVNKTVQRCLFTPFFTTKEAGRGTGLGLTISRDIIAGHGGGIWYDTQALNSSFVFELPA